MLEATAHLSNETLRGLVREASSVSADNTPTVDAAFKAQQAGRHADALSLAKSLLATTPDQEEALLVAGQSCLMLGDHPGAIEYLERLIQLNPRHPIAHNNLGVAREALGELRIALNCYGQAAALEPHYLDAWMNKGLCLEKLEQHETAAETFSYLLTQDPSNSECLLAMGRLASAMGNEERWLEQLRRGVASDPNNGMAWYALGNACAQLKRFREAIAAYGESTTRLPMHAESYLNCASILADAKEFDQALLVCDAAIAIRPNCIRSRQLRALCLREMGHWRQAARAYQEVTALDPRDAAAWANLGFVLAHLRCHEVALDACRTASRLDPEMTVAWLNQAGMLETLLRHDEALTCYERAMEIDPEFPNLLGSYSYRKMYVCNWSDAAAEREAIVEGVRRGRQTMEPFRMLNYSSDAEIQSIQATQYSAMLRGSSAAFPPLTGSSRSGRIRVGYFSADLHLHATSILMANMLEQHDRSRFEVVCYSFGTRQEDAMKQRIRASVDRFYDILDLNDDETVMLARQHALDIAVDLKGYTQDHRIGIFKRRVAPVQISFLGFPGTLGADFMDYILADRVVIPDDLRPFYKEKVIRIPGTYQPNDPTRRPAPFQPIRSDLSLPQDGFVFCCFNNNYKITPEVFSIWMRLLLRTPGSVLWLLADNIVARENLLREARMRGVDAERLVFAGRTSVDEHLARQRAADLFLDTTPYNAHTTASDALRVGLPVLTCTGTSFASRVAASLLSAQGLHELITQDLDAYESMALRLAQDTTLLAQLRKRAELAVTEGALLNSVEHVRNVERAFQAAHERRLAGLEPEHLDIQRG